MLLGWTRQSKRFERDALPHLPAVYRMARQLVGAEAADDLVQETFLRAWKYFDTFDSATNCRAWLFRILRNVWISRWRKSRLELPIPETEEEQIEPYYDWEDEFLRDEMSAETERALSELPADYRLAILLADVEDLTYEEIARVTECPIGTVMSRLNRGRKMLARLIRTYAESKGCNPQPEDFVRRRS
ncbi:MAG TPA: sigma-70 family RNA polymerase sigma factor [Terriglobales bacterium]|nr:sigma-70 family RNA polymerase sigma factor [Terriglobales bacterium]